jgi:single-strand DNA-binding protein
LKKGAKIYIEGQLETRKWTDQSGAEKYSTEIVLRPYSGELQMLDARRGDGSEAVTDEPRGAEPNIDGDEIPY